MKLLVITLSVLFFSALSSAGDQCWKDSHCAAGYSCDIPTGGTYGICVVKSTDDGGFCISGGECGGAYSYCIGSGMNASYGRCQDMGPGYVPCYVGDSTCASSHPAIP